MARSVLITGGSGYFGTILAEQALARGDAVRVLDMHAPGPTLADAAFIAGDVRDLETVRGACDGVEVVFHNIAQVPLAKDRTLFDEVNVGGTANVLVAARDVRVAKVVHTSSSAVYGIPARNPVTDRTPFRPLESYGRAKLRAELACRDAISAGLDVTIIRPRTVLGHGRLGVMALLFDFVADGASIFVLGGGHNRYQFVHAADLADACLRAAATCRTVDLQRRGGRVRNDARNTPGTRRPCRDWLAPAIVAGRAGAFRDACARVAGPCPVRAVSLVAVQRIAVLRYLSGMRRTRLGAPTLERVDADRVVRVVPHPSARRRRCRPLSSSVAGTSGRAPTVEGASVTGAGSVDAVDTVGGVGVDVDVGAADLPAQRRLRRLDALVIGALLVVLAFPLLVALVVLRRPHWYPLLDMAQTELRVRDISAGHPPLIGLAGRIGPFGPNGGSHPGPLSFYALWPVWKAFGGSAYGLFAANVALDGVAIGLCLWIAWRRGGRSLVLAMAAVLAVLTRAYGVYLLTLPWNPYLPVLWWFLFVLAVWSVLADDLAMIPVAVFAGSLCVQTHISYLGLVGGLVLVIAVRLGHQRFRRRRDAKARSGPLSVLRNRCRVGCSPVDPAVHRSVRAYAGKPGHHPRLLQSSACLAHRIRPGRRRIVGTTQSVGARDACPRP